jgi:formylglycine-generating enzyme required for sulfatase activity
MHFIPSGALVVGTPENQLPRIADEEMAGLQLILKGFYIDTFPYPNEEGALPLTNVTQSEAARLCESRDKRLCGELEWERACKGPDNRTHAYGDHYRAEACFTGAHPKL